LALDCLFLLERVHKKCVDLIISYSKRSDLAVDLGKVTDQLVRASHDDQSDVRQSVRSSGGRRRTDLLTSRLGDNDERQLVADFKSGTPKRQLGEQYKISESSVKRLLRRHGVQKPSGHPRGIQ
jgi:FixJ family two-component response regulator